ncbi:hypothetical protein BD408DRAFT_448318 [Parasitella parasitica]|nr:hypothetical protein BD408DRAFT_448318 [Parasitella parasitica]
MEVWELNNTDITWKKIRSCYDPESSFYDLDYVTSVARRLDLAVDNGGIAFAARTISGKKRDADVAIAASSESKKSKYYPGSSVGSASPSGAAAKPVQFKSYLALSKFGNTFAEHVAEGLCFSCNQQHFKRHRCNTGVRTGQSGGKGANKVLRTMSKKQRKGAIDAAVSAALLAAKVDSAIESKKNASAASPPVEKATVDADVEISDNTDGSVSDSADNAADLRDRAQATLVDEMSQVSVTDPDILQNMAPQECMDILSKLGIGIIYGLKLPNLLLENSQIDMKNTACNLPDLIIKLDTTPGSVAWRAQYPLPEAYRDVVAKQIQIWLDEGVILFILDSVILYWWLRRKALMVTTAHKVSFTCPFTNTQYTHCKAAYGIRHVGAVVVRTLQALLADLNTSTASSSFPTDKCYSAICDVDDIILSSNGLLQDHFELLSEVIVMSKV